MRVYPARFSKAPYAAAFMILSLFDLDAAAAEFAPYRAHIAAASAVVRSGPGESFYPTDTLAEGDTVDVYRQQANGWCAIRPPEGSFSWVFGRHIRRLDSAEGNDPESANNLAEIDKPDVASRIGSRLSSQRNAVQVRLKKGEIVRILGEENSDAQMWYKIAPPSGEFRWIHISQIKRAGPIHTDAAAPSHAATAESNLVMANAVASDPTEESPVEPAQATSSAPPPMVLPVSEAPPLLSNTNETPTATTSTTPKSGDTWRVTSENATSSQPTAASSPASPPTTSPTSKITAPPPAAATAAAPAAAGPPAANSGDAASAAPAALSTPEPPPRTPTELELRLSRMVAEPPVAWNIESLQADAKAMFTAAATPEERAALQNTIAKLDRFAAIARRYRQTAATTAGENTLPTITPITGVTLADGTHFDAVGVLRPVASRRPGAPPFALVDERGQVLSFVTPTPGVNLQALVGQRIGVTGNRGFIPEFQRVHVVAGRVAPVSERIVR